MSAETDSSQASDELRPDCSIDPVGKAMNRARHPRPAPDGQTLEAPIHLPSLGHLQRRYPVDRGIDGRHGCCNSFIAPQSMVGRDGRLDGWPAATGTAI